MSTFSKKFFSKRLLSYAPILILFISVLNELDFNYLELAQAELKIIPPWYFNEWTAFPSITGILALIFVSINSSFQYLRKKPEAILTQERMYK